MKIEVERWDGGNVSDLIKERFGFVYENPKILDYCQSLGEVHIGTIDGEFVCCWGLIPPSFLADTAYLWMCAKEPLQHPFVFIRRSQLVIADLLIRYEELVGDCLVDAKLSHRWLQWLGAEFGPPNGKLIPFTIRRANG